MALEPRTWQEALDALEAHLDRQLAAHRAGVDAPEPLDLALPVEPPTDTDIWRAMALSDRTEELADELTALIAHRIHRRPFRGAAYR